MRRAAIRNSDPVPPTRAARASGLRVALGILGCTALLSACQDDPATAPRSPEPGGALRSTGATVVVTSTADAGAGSLRDAIANAADGSLIQFDPSIAGQTITLATELLVTGKSITIEGPQASGMTLSQGGATTRVIEVDFLSGLTIRNLTITGGSGDFGGGIESEGTLVVDHSTISGNHAQTTTVVSRGGGIYVHEGSLTVTNSTISGNSAEFGAGISIEPKGLSGITMSVINSTITNNTASGDGGGYRYSNFNSPDGNQSFTNTIIAKNTAANGNTCEMSGTMNLSWQGTNIVDDNTCGPDPNILVADPLLSPLANNGGPTKTHALSPSSPAIDAVSCVVADDQRYVARPAGAACDIGSYEYVFAASITLDASDIVSSTTGTAIITGHLTCPAGLSAQVQVTVSQTTKNGRVVSTTQGSNSATFSCGNNVAWAMAVNAVGGTFRNGPASVAAKTTNPGSSSTNTASAAVNLFWGHK